MPTKSLNKTHNLKKVLFVTSEITPFIKFSGLGDFSNFLPTSLTKQNIDVDVILPYYKEIKSSEYKIVKQLNIEVPFAGQTHDVIIYKTKLPDTSVDVLLLKNTTYLGEPIGTKNTIHKEVERFAFFNKAVVEYIKAKFNIYDVVHCNNWHTGLINHLLEEEVGQERPATVLTVHNLSYQGISDLELVKELDLDISDDQILQWDLNDDHLNFLLEGITRTDIVGISSTIPAKEVLETYKNKNIVDILKSREDRVASILNGIDYNYYNPSKDKFIYSKYSLNNWKKAKKLNKHILQEELGLGVQDVPVFALISRLNSKLKGLDLLADSLKTILEKDVQLIVLGKGNKEYEHVLRELSKVKKYKGKLFIDVGYDEALSHKIYAASDYFLHPSQVVPLGTSYMIAMKYGSIPVIYMSPELKEILKDDHNVIGFDAFTSEGFLGAFMTAFRMWGSKKWEHMVKNSMESNFNIDKTAHDYIYMYEKALKYRS